MEFNLGQLVDTKVDLVDKGKTLARVVWMFEKGVLKWGRISVSNNGGLWVQVPKFMTRTWVTPLMITDPVLEDSLIKATLKEYELVKRNAEDEIDLDEIPV